MFQVLGVDFFNIKENLGLGMTPHSGSQSSSNKTGKKRWMSPLLSLASLANSSV